MVKLWTVGILAVVAALALGGEAQGGEAQGGEATELWMYSAPADAPDDAEAEASFVGVMVSSTVCAAVAEAMSVHMRGAQRVVAAFQCQAARHVVVEQN